MSVNLCILAMRVWIFVICAALAYNQPEFEEKSANDLFLRNGDISCRFNISIFIYDLGSNFTQIVNGTFRIHEGMYSSENRIFYEFLKSPCRTMDPEKADFFFVPVMTTNVIHKKLGILGADFNAGYNLLYDAYKEISTDFHYFNRSEGRDHIWIVSHDLGSCLAPFEILQGIFLQHNGDKQIDEECTKYFLHTQIDPPSPLLLSRAAMPCYVPGKDIVIPPYLGQTRLLSARWNFNDPQQHRFLASFRGNTGIGQEQHRCYSRGIRQLLAEKWSHFENFSIHEEKHNMPTYFYYEMAMSTFCLCIGGWAGWSQRFQQAMAAGCIPVLFDRNTTDQAFEELINYNRFTIGLEAEALLDLPGALQEVVNRRNVHKMRQNLKLNWRYFSYSIQGEGNVHLINDAPVIIFETGRGVFELVYLSLRRRLLKR